MAIVTQRLFAILKLNFSHLNREQLIISIQDFVVLELKINKLFPTTLCNNY